MARYAVRRVAEALLTLFAVTLATFALLKALPFNIAFVMAGRRATQATMAQLAKEMGLTLPLPTQYVIWLREVVRSGASLAWHHAPQTLELLLLGCVVAAVCAFAVAYLQARRPNSAFDRTASFVAFALYTLPSFWLGFVLIYFFAIELMWLPATGPNADPLSQGFANWLPEMVLPAATLALTTIATWTTYFRGAIEEALRSDYVRTARAKGMPEERVIAVHVLRNAVLPSITIAGMSLPALFNNVIVIEWVFAMHGLGSVLVGALIGFQYGVAVALVVVIGAITILGSLVADLLYAVADPRIRFV